MSNPAVTAAKPFLLSVIQDLKQLNAAVGPDPQKWALTFPPALIACISQVELQLIQLAPAEGAALQSTVNDKLDALTAKINAL